MRSKGVRGLILRVSHGLVLDSRYEEYYHEAIAAGFAPEDVGHYSFINPKRSSASDAAEFAVEHILRISGQSDFLYMLDVESYKQESPNIGDAPVFGPQFAAHIREHIATVKAISPKSRVIGYTNRAYWNGKIYKGSVIEWVGDDDLAAELDWIVARYPVYSLAGYVAKPLPADSAGWDEWAFKAAPDGPFPPRGATWKAWQFSAGYNRQGQPYGCSSSDLDLNIVHADAWAEWTGKTAPTPIPEPLPPPPPPEEDDMPSVILTVNDSPDQYLWTPGSDPVLFASDGDRDQIYAGLKITTGVVVTREMFERLHVSPVTVVLPPPPPLTGHLSADIDTGTWHITGSVG